MVMPWERCLSFSSSSTVNRSEIGEGSLRFLEAVLRFRLGGFIPATA